MKRSKRRIARQTAAGLLALSVLCTAAIPGMLALRAGAAAAASGDLNGDESVTGADVAILQQYLLNWAINPKDYVDYEELEASKQELEELQSIGGKKKLFEKNPYAKREKKDFKRFFSVVNKHLVFYSESSGFYKYYQGIPI